MVISLRNAEEHISTIVTLLVARQVPISSITIHKQTLEDVFFFSFTGKTIREQEAGTADIMRQQMKIKGKH
ncbi:MAG: hypothetical protein WCF90_02120 [Methanomicrobiales archaeon]